MQTATDAKLEPLGEHKTNMLRWLWDDAEARVPGEYDDRAGAEIIEARPLHVEFTHTRSGTITRKSWRGANYTKEVRCHERYKHWRCRSRSCGDGENPTKRAGNAIATTFFTNDTLYSSLEASKSV
jgi:hypothetical protein